MPMGVRALRVLALIVVVPLFMTEIAVAHDHTLPRFEKEQRVAQASAGQEMVDVRAEAATSELTITLQHARTGQPLPGLVRIRDLERDKPVALGALILRSQGWHALLTESKVVVPRRRLRIEALHGLETAVASQEVDLTAREAASVTLRLDRFYDTHQRGWMSGNTHLHLRGLSRDEAARYLRTVSRADGLDLVFVSYLERAGDDADYISNTFTAQDLDRLSEPGVRFADGEEHRHNFGRFGEGYGHVMFLLLKKLIRPVSLGPTLAGAATDGIALQPGIEKARHDGATVIWCHNGRGLEDIPNWIAGRLHALNIFDGDPTGDYKDTFYRYLNVGLRVPFSTGTDWFVYDFSRVYVPLRGVLTARGWLGQLAAGRSFITNGPLLELEVDGRAIGDTVRLKSPGTVQVKARGLGRVGFAGIELVHNGEVVARAQGRTVGGHFEAQMDAPVAIREPGWLALRIPPTTEKSELGQPLFAHTSPVYVEVAGRRIFRATERDALQRDMQESIDAVRTKGTFKDDAEREGILGLYRRAMEQLRNMSE